MVMAFDPHYLIIVYLRNSSLRQALPGTLAFSGATPGRRAGGGGGGSSWLAGGGKCTAIISTERYSERSTR